MPKKASGRRLRRERNRNRNRFPRSRLAKIINPLSTSSSVVWTDNLSISSFTGTPLIALTDVAGVSSQYYNISHLAALQDFIDQSMFEIAQISKVVFTITRAADESVVYSNLHGCSIYLGYSPSLISSAIPYAFLSRDVTSYKIDAMTFAPQVVQLPMLDVWYIGASHPYNNSVKNLYSEIQNLYGQLCIASDNTTNNAATIKLFSVKVEFHVTFYHRM